MNLCRGWGGLKLYLERKFQFPVSVFFLQFSYPLSVTPQTFKLHKLSSLVLVAIRTRRGGSPRFLTDMGGCLTDIGGCLTGMGGCLIQTRHTCHMLVFNYKNNNVMTDDLPTCDWRGIVEARWNGTRKGICYIRFLSILLSVLMSHGIENGKVIPFSGVVYHWWN